MCCISIMNVGSIVRLNDDNEWNGLYGVVKYMHKDVAYIFCIQNPCYLYVATKKNNICIIDE